MKKNCFVIPVIIFLTVTACAQGSPGPAAATVPGPAGQVAALPAQNSTSPGNSLAPGTILSVELSKSLDAKKAKPNDKIEARIATDLLAHGHILVPRKTKVIGHVTEAKAHSKASPNSLVGITFDRLLLKDGREVPLQLAVQAVGRALDVWPSVGSALDSLADASSMAGKPPAMGSQSPVDDSPSGSPTPRYPGSIAEPPSPRTTGLERSTVSPLGPTSRGIVGMKGVSLDTSGTVSVLSSSTENVHLDGGAQLILRVQ
jgi:hypothetical protein